MGTLVYAGGGSLSAGRLLASACGDEHVVTRAGAGLTRYLWGRRSRGEGVGEGVGADALARSRTCREPHRLYLRLWLMARLSGRPLGCVAGGSGELALDGALDRAEEAVPAVHIGRDRAGYAAGD